MASLRQLHLYNIYYLFTCTNRPIDPPAAIRAGGNYLTQLHLGWNQLSQLSTKVSQLPQSPILNLDHNSSTEFGKLRKLSAADGGHGPRTDPVYRYGQCTHLWGKHGWLDQRVESADGPDIGYSKDGVVGIETGYHQTELIPTRFRVESRAKNRRT